MHISQGAREEKRKGRKFPAFAQRAKTRIEKGLVLFVRIAHATDFRKGGTAQGILVARFFEYWLD